MLPRSHRLHNSRDIARVYRKGRSAGSDLFRLAWIVSNRTESRVAVVTSRKLSTKAVRRNLLKRQIRGIIHELLPALAHIDLIIQILPRIIQQAPGKKRDEARKATLQMLGYDQLKSDLVSLLERSRLLNNA